MENVFYVYHHLNKTTGEIFYVGKGKGNRAYSVKSRSSLWHNIVNKYGYEVLIVESDLSEEESFARETYWISLLGRRDLGNGLLINFTDGGDGVRGYVYSDEVKQRMSEAHFGDKNHFYGKTHSEEARKKMREAKKGMTSPMKGRRLSQKTKDLLKYINTGKKHKEETKQKIGNALRGRNIKGHAQTEETKAKISETLKKKKHHKRRIVLQYDMNNNFIQEWPSVSAATEATGFKHIDKVCRGERSHAGNFKWIYKETKD